MCCQYYAAHLEQSIGAQHDHDTRLEESNLDVGMQNMQFHFCLRAHNGPSNTGVGHDRSALLTPLFGS
jgi:hypothetical protein